MRPAIDLIDKERTFAHWVAINSDFIKANVRDKHLLIERVSKLRDEGISISENKILAYVDRIKKARNDFELFSVFFHAAISHLEII